MKKSKKGFLLAGTIITIIACILAVILSLGAVKASSDVTENFVKDIFKEDTDIYTYRETAEGGYYFIYNDKELGEVYIYEDTIEQVALIVKVGLVVAGVVLGGFAIAKFILAVSMISKVKKNKYPKGSTIALLVLSILSFGILEAILLIVAMVIKENSAKEEPVQAQMPEKTMSQQKRDEVKMRVQKQTSPLAQVMPNAQSIQPERKIPNLIVKTIIRKRIHK